MSEAQGSERLERAIFRASVGVILAALVALLVLEHPTEVEVSELAGQVLEARVRREPGRWIVPYAIENRGKLAVEDLRLAIVSEAPAQEIEQELSHLARGARHDGVVIFYGLPPGAKLSVRIVGYRPAR